MKRTSSETNAGGKKVRMADDFDGPSFEEELMMMGDDEMMYEAIADDGVEDSDSTAEKRWKRRSLPVDPLTQSLGTPNKTFFFIWYFPNISLFQIYRISQRFNGLTST